MGVIDDSRPGEPGPNSPNYHAYLVRIWRDGVMAPWRASITHVATGEVRKFADPQSLWAFIERQLNAQSEEENGISLG